MFLSISLSNVFRRNNIRDIDLNDFACSQFTFPGLGMKTTLTHLYSKDQYKKHTNALKHNYRTSVSLSDRLYPVAELYWAEIKPMAHSSPFSLQSTIFNNSALSELLFIFISVVVVLHRYLHRLSQIKEKWMSKRYFRVSDTLLRDGTSAF